MSVLGPDSPLFKKEPNKRGQWLVHRPLVVPLALVVIAPAQQIAYDMSKLGQWVAFVLSQAFVALILFEAWSSVRHLRGFCEYCFHQPAGGPAVAQKHIRQLRFHHLKADKKWIYVGIIVAAFVPTIFLRDWWYVGYAIGLFFLCGFSDKASQTHAWLVPWCPWCKDDGRWTEPSPTPDPSMTKQRV